MRKRNCFLWKFGLSFKKTVKSKLVEKSGRKARGLRSVQDYDSQAAHAGGLGNGFKKQSDSE